MPALSSLQRVGGACSEPQTLNGPEAQQYFESRIGSELGAIRRPRYDEHPVLMTSVDQPQWPHVEAMLCMR